MANTLAASEWSTENCFFNKVESLTREGVSFYVLVSVDNKDHLSPGSLTGTSSHYFTVQVTFCFPSNGVLRCASL